MVRALGNKIAAAQEETRGGKRSASYDPGRPGGSLGDRAQLARAPASAREISSERLASPDTGVAIPLGDGWANTGILSNPLVNGRTGL